MPRNPAVSALFPMSGRRMGALPRYQLRFLVSVLCVRTDAGWHIPAHFTTSDRLPV